MNIKLTSFLLLVLVLFPLSRAGAIDPPPHTNLLGSYGGIFNPSARFGEDRQAFFGINSLPFEHRVIQNNWEDGRSERLLHFNLMFTHFFNVSAHLVQPNNQDKPWGIGDRSFKFRFKILNERKYIPALALGIHDPISSNTYQGALYAVINKSFVVLDGFTIDTHLGYGYNIQNENLITRWLWGENPARRNSPIEGLFGGAQFSYRYHSLLMEYDTEKMNIGYSFAFLHQYNTPWSIRLGIYAIEFKQLSYQFTTYYRFGDRIFRRKNSL